MNKTLAAFMMASAVFGLAGPAHSATWLFESDLDASQVVNASDNITATGKATFSFDEKPNQLSYALSLEGLDLEPVSALRTDFNDVTKIHIHAGAPGVTGPHVLNVFGLPSEDDSDLEVNFSHESLSGIWDDGDAIDPLTGQPFDQTVGGTTKFLSDFVSELQAGNLYVAVHTAGAIDVAIRGQINPVKAVPEPSAFIGLGIMAGLGLTLRRRKQALTQ